MDKQDKINRYRQKDYSQLVEFPVEIVGRNGEIRSYSFEDSIHLYQRRILSAPSRYPDVEVVRAEVQHCRSRIRQLRKSFLERYAPAAFRDRRGAFLGDEEAAEIVALLARYTRATDPAATYSVQQVGTAGRAQMLFVELPGADPLLLYVYRFAGDDAEEVKAEYRRFLAMVSGDGGAGGQAAGDVEHLHAHRATADLALVLTGSEARDHAEGLDELSALFSPWEPQAGPLQACSGLMRAGASMEALRILDGILAEHPDDRNAALTASIAALQAQDPAQAELYVRLALAYQPEDAVLLHQLGVVHVMQGRLAEASETLGQAVSICPSLLQARLLAALVELHLGRTNAASRLVVRAEGESRRGTPLAQVRSMVTRTRLRTPSLVLTALAIATSILSVALGLPWAALSFVAVAGCSAVLLLSLRHPAPLVAAHDLIRRIPVPREILPAPVSEPPRQPPVVRAD